jgi:ABC-type multidrug transport system ATPase subunit
VTGTASPDAIGKLELQVNGRSKVLDPSRPFVIGRGAEADLDIGHPTVSRRHLVLEASPQGWQVTDHSRNGTFLAGTRIDSLLVTQPLTLMLGNPVEGATLALHPLRGQSATNAPLPASNQGRLSTVVPVTQKRITIGRLPDNDLVVDDMLVSRRHAELRSGDAGWKIIDLNSPNGTFVNGQRVHEAGVGPDDIIGIGRALLHLRHDQLVVFADEGDNTFEASELSITTAKGKPLLQSVSFGLGARSVLAVIGPSGAGKSTLLGALIGARPADSGTVRYAGRDLYQDYDELRHRIALVPQDDVLHTQLTVRQALTYAARLRFPADTSAADRRQRVDEVIAELGLDAQADQRIDSLSGGQRKRTSVALELLTKPSLLFLDEPTSGLDPGMDRAVMHTLRELADEGRSVVVVTHSVTNLEQCDKVLVLAPGGWVAYFGSPKDTLAYFGKNNFADIFLLLAEHDGHEWAERFRTSSDYLRSLPQAREPAVSRRRTDLHPDNAPRQQGTLTQVVVLCRRYAAVIASDRQYVAFLAAMPLVLSLLAWAVPGESGLSVSAALPTQDAQPRQLLLVLIIGAALMGTAASMRELVKERPIYRRERAIGLSIGAYLASKILILTLVTGVQAAVFTLLGLIGRNAPDVALLLSDGRAEIMVAVFGVTLASMLIGLLLSALIDNADRGMPLLVVFIMVQLVLCGGLFEVYGRLVLEQASWLVPSRWGFSMVAATADVGQLIPGDEDPLWEHAPGVWLANAALLTSIGFVAIILTAASIKRLDPQR